MKLNGYSNQYWGWGGEDDDLQVRLKESGYTIIRPYDETSKYKMISHEKDHGNEDNPHRHNLLSSASKRLASDGLSVSLPWFHKILIFKDLTYKVLSKDFNTFYLNITVDPHYPITNFPPPSIPATEGKQNETEVNNWIFETLLSSVQSAAWEWN